MSDRPDWLSEPIPKRAQPLGSRVYRGGLEVASMLFGLIGAGLAFWALYAAWHIVIDQNKRLAILVMLYCASLAIILLASAARLRWLLRRDRQNDRF